jgi:hypothetical protein
MIVARLYPWDDDMRGDPVIWLLGSDMINNIIKMEMDSSDITQQTLPDHTLESIHDQVIQLSRFSAPSKKTKSNRSRKLSTLAEEKLEKETDGARKEERIRLAAKGVRQPVIGELTSSKMLQGFREPPRSKKGVFFLCC